MPTCSARELKDFWPQRPCLLCTQMLMDRYVTLNSSFGSGPTAKWRCLERQRALDTTPSNPPHVLTKKRLAERRRAIWLGHVDRYSVFKTVIPRLIRKMLSLILNCGYILLEMEKEILRRLQNRPPVIQCGEANSQAQPSPAP